MKNTLWLITVFLLCLPLTTIAADDDNIDPIMDERPDLRSRNYQSTSLLINALPPRGSLRGVHFKRRFDIEIDHSGKTHELPGSYAVPVPAEKKRSGFEEHLMIGFYSNLRSRYMSKQLPDSIGPVWQPSATIEAYGFGLNTWANFVLYDEPNQGQFNEIDFTTYYTVHIGNLTIHPYFLAIVFPNKNPRSLDYTRTSTMETDLYLDYLLWKFTFFALMRTQVKGTTPGSIYAHVGTVLNHTFENGITISPSMLMSFGNDKFLSSSYQPMGANIDAFAFTFAASWKVLHHLIFKPHINYAVHVIPKIRQNLRSRTSFGTYYIWGGLDLSCEF